MGGMGGGAGANGGGDVNYPLYLVNGRVPEDPDVLRARPGERVRLRIINAAADTIYDVALGGHRLRVTHSDGHPVQPVTARALRLGMGERYDAVVTLGDGVFGLGARPVGKTGTARALIRTASGAASMSLPAELDAQTVHRCPIAGRTWLRPRPTFARLDTGPGSGRVDG